MDYRILQQDCSRLGIIESEIHAFTADASTLGFPVGQFPDKIETNMGNSLPFVLVSQMGRNGDLLWVLYRQSLGCISLKVFND